jgi:LL-diaminopimelate aminotransferase
VNLPKASLYLWARIPDGFTSAEYAAKILDATGVVVTPGTGYGKCGEGYIRLSMTATDADIDEGLSRLLAWSQSGSAKK